LSLSPSTRPSPAWPSSSAEDHRSKHTKCFERLLGVKGREVTIDEFKERAQGAINGSWAEFEARKLANDKAAYFIDDELVQAVTTLDRQVFRTCFHLHFAHNAKCEDLIAMTPGDRRARFIRNMDYDMKGEVLKDVKRIRGI